MSHTPIYDQLKAEADEARLREVLGPDADCEACRLMYFGWGGPGCCDICNQTTAEHTCEGRL